jgi:peptidoglycan-associated lipoprotein
MEDTLKFLMPVHFEFDQATVREADHPALQRFASVVQKYYPESKITVEGFADPAGSASYNTQLSRKRAEAVRDALVTHGLMGDRVAAVGYGETRLVNARAQRDDPGAEMNRRVVFVIETAGSPISAVTAMSGQVRDQW